MKIAIALVQVPFIKGGAEICADMLKAELIRRGHEADIINIPFKWYPSKAIINSMLMGRMMDLTEVNGERVDLVIAMKFPAYYVKHDNKVLWLMHQHRQAYDLWGTEYGDMHNWDDGESIRAFIERCDNKYIAEARRVYTIAQNTSNRLEKYNGIKSQAIYQPPQNHEKLYCGECGDYIFYPSRIDEMKRQRLLVEAARYLKTDVKIRIAGRGPRHELEYIEGLISKYSLQDRVQMMGFISDEEKIQAYANCLGVYFGAYDEDYGFITLEGFFSHKPVIVHTDSGGPLEFVRHGENGYVIEPDALQVAEHIDMLYNDKARAVAMGEAGYKRMIDMNISWDYVIDCLLQQ